MGWKDSIKETPAAKSWRDTVAEESVAAPAPMDFAPKPQYTAEQEAMIYAGSQDKGLGQLALEGTGKVLDYTGGVTRTGLASAFGEGGEEGQLLKAIQANPISGQQFLTQFGAENPTPVQGFLAETLVDPGVIFSAAKGATAAAKAAPKLASNLMNAAYKPAAQKLFKKGINLGESLLSQGFKGGTSKAAKEFVENQTAKGLLEREAISAAASQGALAPRAMPRATDLVTKATGEAIDGADARVIGRMEKDLAKTSTTPRSLKELEQVKRGLNRKISDAARDPAKTTSIQDQFWKASVKDIDDEIIGRLSQGSVDDAAKYAAQGPLLRSNIKATPLLGDMANAPSISQIDYILGGGGALGAGITDNPEWLGALALKKAATNPYLLSKAANLIPKLAKPAGAAAGAGAYGLLKQLTNQGE